MMSPMEIVATLVGRKDSHGQLSHVVQNASAAATTTSTCFCRRCHRCMPLATAHAVAAAGIYGNDV